MIFNKITENGLLNENKYVRHSFWEASFMFAKSTKKYKDEKFDLISNILSCGLLKLKMFEMTLFIKN